MWNLFVYFLLKKRDIKFRNVYKSMCVECGSWWSSRILPNYGYQLLVSLVWRNFRSRFLRAYFRTTNITNDNIKLHFLRLKFGHYLTFSSELFSYYQEQYRLLILHAKKRLILSLIPLSIVRQKYINTFAQKRYYCLIFVGFIILLTFETNNIKNALHRQRKMIFFY